MLDEPVSLPEGTPGNFRPELLRRYVGIKQSGSAGPEGPQGPTGEVSQAQLDAAISGTANNPSGIAPYAGTFSDPPTQAEMQDFAAWVESLRSALVR